MPVFIALTETSSSLPLRVNMSNVLYYRPKIEQAVQNTTLFLLNGERLIVKETPEDIAAAISAAQAATPCCGGGGQ